MDNLTRLLATLRRALEQEQGAGPQQELFEALQAGTPALKRVGRVPAQNAAERREIESGKLTLRGKQLAINADFARHALFLSDQLHISERTSAALLHDIKHYRPNASALDGVEAVVEELHRRRLAAVEALLLLLQASLVAEEADAPQIYKWIDKFVRQEILSQTGPESLTLVVLAEIEATSQTLQKAQGARIAAISQTSIPATTGGAGSLGYDILQARCKSLQEERQTLAGVLYLIARLGWLTGGDIKKLVDWLQAHPQDPSTYQILTATLSAIQPVSAPTSASRNPRQSLLTDRTLALHMRTCLAPSVKWLEPSLRAALSLQWALFVTEARHRDAGLEHVQGYTTEEVEALIWNGAQADGFSYLEMLVRRSSRQSSASVDDTPILVGNTEHPLPPTPSSQFVVAFLDVLEVLIRTLIRHASSELRKIKQRQEDVVLANARVDRTSRLGRSAGVSTATQTSSQTPPRNDIASLYSLIGALYACLPSERALQFWGANPLANVSDPAKNALAAAIQLEGQTPRLPAFLQWSAWSTQASDHGTLTALYHMLAGLSNGQHCSELAYNFVAQGAGENTGGAPAVSWTSVFGLLESWATTLSAPKPQQPQTASGFGSTLYRPPTTQTQLVLGPRDVLFAQAFLRFLAAVVTYSIDVRKAIAGHGHFRAIPTLVTLIPLGVPLELKGALFDTLAAFCEPGAGPAGVDICKAVWGLMERMEVISLRSGAVGVAGVRGVEVELEEVEAVYKLYPSTLPFLHLLATLIHTPKRLRLRDRLLDVEPLSTVPDALGSPYRSPGIGPFIAFVVDNVFVQIPQREYLRPCDRWRMNDSCLCFVERCLAAYDLSALTTLVDNSQITPELLVPFATHPGHDVLQRLLTSTPLQALILSYIADGVDGFDRGFASEEPFFHSTLVRVLRIVHRVLELQDAFLDVLVPLLTEVDRTSSSLPRSSFTPFDAALSFGSQYVPALATYVSYADHQELVFLSVNILAQLARSPALPNLATLLERSANSERILQGYIRVLGVDALQEVADAEAVAEERTGAGASDVDSSLDLAQATRLAALDLFAENTASSKSYPNLAHFLLLGDSQAQQIENPQALHAEVACVHVLIETLNGGVPRLNNTRPEDTDDLEPLFTFAPALAERHLRIIFNLCSHPRTSDFTTRYLRSREDFFLRQLAAAPFQAPSLQAEPCIMVKYGDGAQTVTTASAVSSFLRYRSLVLDLAALDLHIQTSKTHSRGVAEIVQLLFTLETSRGDGDQNLEDVLRPFQALGQSHIRIIELANALDFEWADSLTVAHTDLRLLGNLNLQACMRNDGSGCEIVDQGVLVALLTSARRTLQTQGRITSQADADQLAAEVTYVLQSCAIENHRREVGHAIASGFEAWRRLFDVALSKCFDKLTASIREDVLFDILHLLPRLLLSENIQASTRVLLAETVVSTIMKVREDRKQQVAGSGAAAALPVDRLHALLRGLVDCLLDPRQGALVRGNLYASLVDYLQLINTSPTSLGRTSESLVASALSFSTFDRVGAVASSGSQALRRGSLAILNEIFGRLVATVSRDALDGAEVWKTVAFMLLDAFVELAGSEANNVVVASLTQGGMLANFVQAIQRDDRRLQLLLEPEPEDFNALYVYEAQMSMLIRIAQSRQGAERLHELGILPILSRAEFIDSRPEGSLAASGDDDFLPPTHVRYHQLLMPALQVVSSLLGTLGSTHVSIGNQALEFFISHRDIIATVLRGDSEIKSLLALREVHIIVYICNMIVPRVPKKELDSSITGYGSIHAAILAVASFVLRNGFSTSTFHPQTDAEIADAQVADLDDSASKFDVAVREATNALQHALATYLGTASEFTEPDLSLVLSPEVSQRQDRASRYAGIPSVIDTLQALEVMGRRLASTLIQLAELSADLGLITQPEELALSQPYALQLHASPFEAPSSPLRERIFVEARSMTNTMETLLLLLWRHITTYIDREEGVTLSVPTSFSQSTRGSVTYDQSAFRAEVTRQLQPALQHLTSLPLDEQDPTWRRHAIYINIIIQKLREAVDFPDVPS